MPGSLFEETDRSSAIFFIAFLVHTHVLTRLTTGIFYGFMSLLAINNTFASLIRIHSILACYSLIKLANEVLEWSCFIVVGIS